MDYGTKVFAVGGIATLLYILQYQWAAVGWAALGTVFIEPMEAGKTLVGAGYHAGDVESASRAARAQIENTELSPEEVIKKSLTIAGDLCIYTNQCHTIEVLKP